MQCLVYCHIFNNKLVLVVGSFRTVEIVQTQSMRGLNCTTGVEIAAVKTEVDFGLLSEIPQRNVMRQRVFVLLHSFCDTVHEDGGFACAIFSIFSILSSSGMRVHRISLISAFEHWESCTTFLSVQ
jgi:hypothetical protein